MKNLVLILSLVATIFTSCNSGNQQIEYKSYQSDNKTYTVDIPADIPIYYKIGDVITFFDGDGGQSVTIEPTTSGFDKFDKNLHKSGSKLKYNVYKNTANEKFAQCIKGFFSAVELAMIKNINGTDYLIKYSAPISRRQAEQRIRHIYNSLTRTSDTSTSTSIPTSTSASAANSSDDKFETYSNSFFSVSYPNDWKTAEQVNEMTDVYIGSEDGMLGFTVVRFTTDAPLKEVVREAETNSEQAGMKIISSSYITLNGAKWHKMINEFTYADMELKTIGYTIKKGNTLFNVKFGTQKKLVDENLKLIEQVINSFKTK